MKIKMFDLPCYDGRKSFIGKAKVIETESGKYLLSFNTIVCGLENGIFKRFWDGYSMTTLRHVNSFCEFLGLHGGSKRWWNNLSVYQYNQ